MRVEQSERCSLAQLCSLLGYSRQAYYQNERHTEKQLLQEDLIIEEVRRIRQSQRQVGGRKLLLMINEFMRQHNSVIGRDVFFKLLRHRGLLMRKRKSKKPRTTWSGHWFKRHPYLIENFEVTASGQLWVSDVTYIPLKEAFAYLSLVTDAYSRKIVGFCLSPSLAARGCIEALKQAIACGPKQEGLIYHSDRGIQYCCNNYISILQKENILISMTPDGDPKKNAIAERVNGILKGELLQRRYSTFEEAERGICAAITTYNNQRLHSSIDMLTPQQAHHLTGPLKRHWKTYYKKREEALFRMV